MVPTRLRRLVEDLLPWYDRAAEARHDERSRYIHDRSVQIRQGVEQRLADPVFTNRIRSGYTEYDQRFRR
jgi:hypothetical protein